MGEYQACELIRHTTPKKGATPTSARYKWRCTKHRDVAVTHSALSSHGARGEHVMRTGNELFSVPWLQPSATSQLDVAHLNCLLLDLGFEATLYSASKKLFLVPNLICPPTVTFHVSEGCLPAFAFSTTLQILQPLLNFSQLLYNLYIIV